MTRYKLMITTIVLMFIWNAVKHIWHDVSCKHPSFKVTLMEWSRGGVYKQRPYSLISDMLVIDSLDINLIFLYKRPVAVACLALSLVQMILVSLVTQNFQLYFTTCGSKSVHLTMTRFHSFACLNSCVSWWKKCIQLSNSMILIGMESICASTF